MRTAILNAERPLLHISYVMSCYEKNISNANPFVSEVCSSSWNGLKLLVVWPRNDVLKCDMLIRDWRGSCISFEGFHVARAAPIEHVFSYSALLLNWDPTLSREKYHCDIPAAPIPMSFLQESHDRATFSRNDTVMKLFITECVMSSTRADKSRKPVLEKKEPFTVEMVIFFGKSKPILLC